MQPNYATVRALNKTTPWVFALCVIGVMWRVIDLTALESWGYIVVALWLYKPPTSMGRNGTLNGSTHEYLNHYPE